MLFLRIKWECVCLCMCMECEMKFKFQTPFLCDDNLVDVLLNEFFLHFWLRMSIIFSVFCFIILIHLRFNTFASIFFPPFSDFIKLYFVLEWLIFPSFIQPNEGMRERVWKKQWTNLRNISINVQFAIAHVYRNATALSSSPPLSPSSSSPHFAFTLF